MPERISLNGALANLYGGESSIRRVLEEATIDPTAIQMSGSAGDVWTAAIAEARKQRKMKLLTEVALSEYPEYAPLREAIESLLVQRPDGYRVYVPDDGRGNGYRDAINRIDAELRQAEAERDKLRDEMYRRDDDNWKAILTERHNLLGLRNDFSLQQQLTGLKMQTLIDEQKRQAQLIDRLNRPEQALIWIGVAMGAAAVVGQGILILVLRFTGML